MKFVMTVCSWGKGFWSCLSVGMIAVNLFCVGAATARDFVVLGKEGVWIRQGSTVFSGDIGGNQAGEGPYLNGEQEVTIGHDVVIQDPESRVMGNTIRVKSGSQVQSIAVNTLVGSGQIQGTVTTPVTLPLVSALPSIPHVRPGSQDINVPENETLTLPAGRYGRLKIRSGGTVFLAGGRYHFQEWDIREGACVFALNPVEIQVKGQIDTNRHSVIGPAPESGTLTAADVVIIGIGINGTTGGIDDTPEAVKFGEGSTVRANVYVPNGLLWIKANSQATGAFVGKWVRMGNHSTIALEGGFGLGMGGNAAPVAQAGADQTLAVGTIVQLDGTDSTDINGDLLTYHWTLLSRPPGSMANLSETTAIMPTLAIDLPGIYSIQLIVNDGTVDSEPDVVTITTINSPPVAQAGPAQTVFVTQSVTLNGNGSHDVDGDSLSFNWSLVNFPSGSLATLSQATSPSPSFQVDRPGTYQVQLIVNDGHEDSEPATVFINTQNSKPVAHPGQDQTVPVGSTVQLDGRQSSDVDGDPLTFHWALIAMPAVSTAILSDSTVVQPTFVADVAGVYVVQLIVRDGMEDSVPATVTIMTGNIPPLADAGTDQDVPAHALVTLNGSGSRDMDGDVLTFQWTLESRPQGSTATILNPTFARPTLVPDVPGTYVATLVVSDSLASSAPDTVVITVQPPAPLALPALVITSPADGSVVGASPITVSGFVSDSTATVHVNGISATVTGGVFLADGIPLQEGQNTLVVTGIDGAGHTNMVNLTVTRSATSTYLTPIWGPVEWVKQTTEEETFLASFSNCEPAAQYQLVVINGLTGGANRVNQGTVLLNGVEVIGAQGLTSAHHQVIQSVVVQGMNTLELRVSGPIGAQVQVYIACTANCLKVAIDAPLAGATINESTMVVKGTVVTSDSGPVGVVINQQAAKVFGGAYGLDRVSVREGTGTLGNTIVVVEATNTCGQKASATTQVQTTELFPTQIQLRVSPDRNVAPSLAKLRFDADLEQPIAQIQWDYQGDGIIDAQGPDLLEQTVTYTNAGLLQPTVFVTDSAGNAFEATTIVLVEDAVAFEVMLNAKWSGLMDALGAKEIEQALSFILLSKREIMRHDWNVLKDHLPELAAIFSVPLHLTDGQDTRVVAQGAAPLTLGTVQFPLEVEFILDTDGQWRIRNY